MGRDPEYLAFMRQVAAGMSAAAAAPSTVDEERARLAAELAQLPRTPVHARRDVVAAGHHARLYLPRDDEPGPGLVFFHGGGWYLGSVDAFDPLAQALAVASGVAILSVEYRLAPEHPFPAAVNDAVEATAWAVAHAGFTATAVGGDSAGGNLAAVAARHVPGLAAQVLLYPVLDLRQLPEDVADPDGLVFPREMEDVRERYLAGADPADPDVSPLAVEELSGLPPALIMTAEYDRLRPQGHAYAARLEANGVPATLLDLAGLDHAFLAWSHFAGRCREGLEATGEAIATTLRGQSPLGCDRR